MARVLSALFVVTLIVCIAACRTTIDDSQNDLDEDKGSQAEKSPDEKSPDEKSPDKKSPDKKPADGKSAGTPAETADTPTEKPTVDLTQLRMDVLTEEQLAEGWIRLFDGLTLFGWESGSAANWRVEEGSIVVDDGEAGLLCTNVDFADYVLRVDFKADSTTNSGIFLRTPIKPADPAIDCYELNIAPDDNPFPTGSLVKRQKAEGHNKDDWQTFEVTLSGPTVTVKLNGEQILQAEDPKPVTRGRIGLQLNSGRVAFRNIYLKPLSLEPIFDGKSLAGWKQYPEMDGKFTVSDEGLLHVENGRGQLETEQAYGDFALQLQCRTNAPHLNSGVFFRCIPGEQTNGYESQIQNQIKTGITDPFDCGTGGIFRRVDARIVAASDQKWFHKTIVATGSRFGVWVNGLQVTAWEDVRKPDANPRRGLRTEPGTIMLQAHDPTTDIDFREFKIATMPAE